MLLLKLGLKFNLDLGHSSSRQSHRKVHLVAVLERLIISHGLLQTRKINLKNM